MLLISQNEEEKKEDRFFVWKDVTEKAKEIFNNGLFALYELHNGTESLINNEEQLTLAQENGSVIAIEVGFIELKSSLTLTIEPK